MSSLYNNTIKCYVRSFMIGSIVLTSLISLPTLADGYCHYSDSQDDREEQLANKHKLSITVSKKKNNSIEPEENNEIFTISKSDKVLYKDLTELCVTKRLDLIVKKDKKTGVIDAAGQLIIPFEYDSIYPYDETFVVKKEWLFGLVDRQNQPLSAIEYYFSDSTLVTAEDKLQLPLIGYKKIDASGINTNVGAWGSIDSSGTLIIPFIYDEISTISSLSYEETTGVYKVKKDDYWGVIDNKGDTILPTNYQEIYWFNAPENLYLVIKNNQKVVIDSNENTLIKGNIEHISFIDMQEERELSTYDYEAHDGTLRPAIIKINDKYGLFDSDANQRLPAEYDDLSYLYQSDLVSAKKNSLYGVVNAQGEFVIPLIYNGLETVLLINEPEQPNKLSYFIVKQGQDFGLLSLDNKVILPFEYQSMTYNAFDIANRIVASRHTVNDTNTSEKKKTKFALLNIDGKSITPFIYDKIEHDDYDSRIHVWQEGKEGLIDANGQVLLASIYDSLDYNISEYGYNFKRDGLYGWLTDTDYKEIIPAIYDGPFDFEEGVATVIKDGVTMTIDKQGKRINGSR